ncbi:hypothetical protein MAPG_08145 [Magnaporthiopsis poae ATCC 64411]|uniref:Ricin B lectin domain-containing protein n=1 Tax=Magnaporthiopsis poae (strain ATCC 64411 / 73-15) TaxID=644358 RepID=A0A0C4E6K3_MAGP6|nr:hypothetical protein MAPG_08145 [Magnaporthiopsis poae ATCC 64411]
MFCKVSAIVAYAALTAASPIVPSLNEDATKEAHQRDNGATRFRSDVQIKTSDGNCLTIDKLSGDFRANLTPIQVAPCGSKDGQGFDIITAGKHLDQPNSMLVVSTLTQACLNFDPRRAAGNQALLFSCGGRADGGGQATSSQQFAFSGNAGSLTFEPNNAKGKCFTVKGNALDVATCNAGDAGQKFTIGGAGGGGGNNAGSGGGNGQQKPSPATSSPNAGNGGDVTRAPSTTTTTPAGRAGSTPAPTSPARNGGGSNNGGGNSGGGNSGGGNNNGNNGNGSGNSIPNPTTPVPVSRAGGKLQPSAAAEAQERDGGAQRSLSNVQIRAPDGRCLFVDPTAGDFRQNLIPVAAAPCAGTPNERFDVVTRGKHNDGRAGGSLLVSSLMNGCVSVDPRRAAGDTVTMFSCGGRADGGGETNSGQLFKIDTGNAGGGFTLAPLSDDGKVCVVMGGDGRLVTGPCAGNAGQRFEIVQ